MQKVNIANFMELSEVKLQRDGTVPVKVIQPGWGSSGFYSHELLENHAANFNGVQMYWNHPTPDEDKTRPERNLNDLAAVLNNVRFREDGPEGAGVYGYAKVFSPFKERIGELAPYIGVSILAQGQGNLGEAEGKEGLIIESIDLVRSVDFVTKAGAGGKVVEMFEAAREPLSVKEDTDDAHAKEVKEDMELKEAVEELAATKAQLKEAETKVAEQDKTITILQEQVARAAEAEVLREAKAVVELTISKVEGLPDITKERLVSQLSANPPVKDGELDKPALEGKVEEAVKAEADYIAKLTKSGHIQGMGGDGDNEAKAQESLKGAFTRLGLSETAANIAVAGRTH